MHSLCDGGEKLASTKCSDLARSSGQHLYLTSANLCRACFCFSYKAIYSFCHCGTKNCHAILHISDLKEWKSIMISS